MPYNLVRWGPSSLIRSLKIYCTHDNEDNEVFGDLYVQEKHVEYPVMYHQITGTPIIFRKHVIKD